MEEKKARLVIEDASNRSHTAEQDVTYWEFAMVSPATSSNRYYMSTLYDSNKRLWVQFTQSYSQMTRTVIGNYHNFGSLSMPWAVFERGARKVLDGPVGVEVRFAHDFLTRGRLRKVSEGRIVYITECRERYTITEEELEALLS